jgi:aminocarboxymuconate-semialdehyde decarboxylase
MHSKSPVIDFHVHALEPTVFQSSTNKTVFTGFGANPVTEPRPGAKALIDRMFDAKTIIEDMDVRGIDRSVVTSSTVLQGTSWAEAQLDLSLCQRCNDQAAAWVAAHPTRMVGSMVLPLQDVGLALQELRRAHEQLGLQVVNASSSYKGIYLGDARFDAFWDEVAGRGLTVWVHPEGVEDPWFQSYGLWNSLGQSIEETKCMASLIYSGVMARYDSLKVVMAHGGGYFPHYLGRIDRNAVNRPDTVKNLDGKTPRDFLKSFYYDTCVYDPRVLEALISLVGTERLVMGSDYPVGEKTPLQWLQQVGLEGEALAAVAGGNAANLLGL